MQGLRGSSRFKIDREVQTAQGFPAKIKKERDSSAVVALVPPNRATRRLGTRDPRAASHLRVDEPLHLAVVAKTNTAQLCFRLPRRVASAT